MTSAFPQLSGWTAPGVPAGSGDARSGVASGDRAPGVTGKPARDAVDPRYEDPAYASFFLEYRQGRCEGPHQHPAYG